MIPVVSAGPKGVIHDWRKFKLESEDHESSPQKRRELLRQMSNPKASDDDNYERINRKVIIQYHKSTNDFNPSNIIIFSIPLSPCLMTHWFILFISQNWTFKLTILVFV